jgi:hypothetical protein
VACLLDRQTPVRAHHRLLQVKFQILDFFLVFEIRIILGGGHGGIPIAHGPEPIHGHGGHGNIGGGISGGSANAGAGSSSLVAG